MKTTIKRILLVCLSLVMMFATCINANAVWVSNWEDSVQFPGVAVRQTLYNEEGISSTIQINEEWYTEDIFVYVDCCTYYAEDDPEDPYEYYTTDRRLTDVYNPLEYPYTIRSTTFFSSDILDIYYEFYPMHIAAGAITFLCDYIWDEDASDYTHDAIFTYVEYIDESHISSSCSICGD